MKKLLYSILALALCFTFASCNPDAALPDDESFIAQYHPQPSYPVYPVTMEVIENANEQIFNLTYRKNVSVDSCIDSDLHTASISPEVSKTSSLYHQAGLFNRKKANNEANTDLPPVTDDTPTPPADTKDLMYIIGSIILAVYELLVRLVPTAGSWSILTWIMRFLRMILPDRKAQPSNLVTKSHL